MAQSHNGKGADHAGRYPIRRGDQLGQILHDYRRRVLARLARERRAWPS